MAFPYAELEAYVQANLQPTVEDQVYTKSFLLKRLMARNQVKIDPGTQIEQPIGIAKSGGQNSTGEYDTIVPVLTKTRDKAVLDFVFKDAYSHITDADIQACSGAPKVIDLVTDRWNQMTSKLTDLLATGVYSDGTSSDEMEGLRLACQITGTYAGIAKGTYAYWQSAGVSTGTTLTTALMQTAFGACSNNDMNQEGPTAIVTTQAIYNTFWALAQPQQRSSGDNAGVGWSQSIPFNGIPVVPDTHCPAYHMFFLNERHIDLWVSKHFNFDFVSWQVGQNQPHVKSAYLKWSGGMLVKQPRTNYMFTSLTA